MQITSVRLVPVNHPVLSLAHAMCVLAVDEAKARQLRFVIRRHRRRHKELGV